ncbi:DUF1254 domain-containing protein [Vibrio paucivorans]
MKKLTIATAILTTLCIGSATAAGGTRENFVQMETSKYFSVTIAKSELGKQNSWRHFRTTPKTEEQPIVRMNRDTIYSTAVVDTEGGASITLPDMDGRFAMVQFTDENHQTFDLVYTDGDETITVPDSTKYMFVVVRIYLPDLNDQAEISRLNKLQDQFVINASSDDKYVSFDNMPLPELAAQTEGVKRELLLEIADIGIEDSEGMFGMDSYTSEESKLQGTAYG